MAKALNTGILKEKSTQGPGTRDQGGTRTRGLGWDSDLRRKESGRDYDHGVSCLWRELDQGLRESGRDSDPTLRVASPT